MKQSISLYELNCIIKRNFEDNFSNAYWIISEISEIRRNASGHCYLELIETKENDVIAKVKANLWAYNYNRISTYFETVTNTKLQPGIKVLVNAKVNYHPLYGLSLTINEIDPNYTLGEKQRRKIEIIKKLKEEGVYELNKTLHLPNVIQRLAIISSSKSAGYDDFIKQLDNNEFGYSFRCDLYQSAMQGNAVEGDIIKALYKIYDKVNDYDAIILIRGGGAAIDLDCFDNYNLASHLAQFPLPILTGIGHQRDETIVDLIAHSRLKTPTAVSAFILNYNREYEQNLEKYYNKIIYLTKHKVAEEKEKLNSLCNTIEINGTKIIGMEKQHIQSLQNNIISNAKSCIKNNKSLLDFFQKRLSLSTKKPTEIHRSKLENIEQSIIKKSNEKIKFEKQALSSLIRIIEILDPKNTLKRGFSISYDSNNKIVKQTSNLNPEEKIKTLGYNYELITRVQDFTSLEQEKEKTESTNN